MRTTTRPYSAALLALVLLVAGVATVLTQETFQALAQRLQKEKPQFAQRQDAEEQSSAVSRSEKGRDPSIGAELTSFRDEIGVEKITCRHAQSSTLRPVSRSRSIVKSSTWGPPSRCDLKSGLCARRAR